MNFLKAALALFFAVAMAVPARADPTTLVLPSMKTGLQATDVGPILQGVAAQSVQMAVFAGCFLALDDNETCVEIAGKARDRITPPKL